MDYRAYIKSYMKENRISYADLAVKLGVTRQRVWNLLNSKTRKSMKVETADKIFRALGLELKIMIPTSGKNFTQSTHLKG